MKEIFCRGCRKVTGYLEAGSKIAKGTEYLCHKCVKKIELKLAADNLKDKTKSGLGSSAFTDIFGDIFN